MTIQQPILTVCAWCDTRLDGRVGMASKAQQAQLILVGHLISHGICASCRDKELEQWRESQRKAGGKVDGVL